MRITVLPAASLVLVAGMLLAGCASAGPEDEPDPDAAPECGTITIGTLDDDSHRAQVQGITTGAVTSDIIDDVQVDFLQIPALIQATGSGQYDLLGISVHAVVLAREASGADLRIVGFGGAHTGGGMSIYVPADSDIQSAEDLAGRSLGTFSFGSTATAQTQIVLAEKYGLDFALEGGDVSWVELDPPTLLDALQKGNVDAAMLFYQAAYLADQNPDLRKIAQVDADFEEVTGGWPIGSAFISEGEWVDANPECLAEIQRMMDESITYAEENIADFSDEIAEQTGVSADYVEYFWNPDHYRFGGTPDEEWIGWAQGFYDQLTAYGVFPTEVDITEIISTP